MGGERSSTTRQREAGKICCSCKVPLDASPWQTGERHYAKCQPRQRVYMNFMLVKSGWYCQFLREDLMTPLARKLTFADSDKVVEMARRGGADWTSADRQNLEFAIQKGRGAVWLRLTPEQLEKLR